MMFSDDVCSFANTVTKLFSSRERRWATYSKRHQVDQCREGTGEQQKCGRMQEPVI